MRRLPAKPGPLAAQAGQRGRLPSRLKTQAVLKLKQLIQPGMLTPYSLGEVPKPSMAKVAQIAGQGGMQRVTVLWGQIEQTPLGIGAIQPATRQGSKNPGVAQTQAKTVVKKLDDLCTPDFERLRVVGEQDKIIDIAHVATHLQSMFDGLIQLIT